MDGGNIFPFGLQLMNLVEPSRSQQSGEGWPLHRPADEAILISAHLSFLLSRPSPQLRLLTDCVQQPGG
ncbi:MAG: hypothetical protein ACK5TG_15055, partial [Planctomyces sp.]